MGGDQQLIIPARIDQVEAACDFVAEVAAAVGMGDDAIYHCRLSVEEVCTNVIEHGYEDQGGEIRVVCSHDSSYFTITIADTAPAFNPLSLPEPDPATPLWERQGGGWGVHFVKKYMDRVTYAFRDQQNHLIMYKRL